MCAFATFVNLRPNERERGGVDPIEQVFAAPKNVSSQIPLLSSNIDLVKTILSVFNFPKCSKKGLYFLKIKSAFEANEYC